MIDASATVGNFGPGFDVFSLALADVGDRISVTSADEDHIVMGGPDADVISLEWDQNIAGVVIDALRAKTGVHEPVGVAIDKGQPAGSGLGSSASSAAGAALAYHHKHAEHKFSLEDLFEAAHAGEARFGGGSYDDIAAVLLGGLVAVQPTDGMPRLHRFEPPQDLVVAVAAPELHLPTTEMRALLPQLVPRQDAVWNLGQSAALLRAFTRGDVKALGECLEDRLAVPYRLPRVAYLDVASAAAKRAGAYGACLSGSGPAVVAICDDHAVAKEAALAMAEAVQEHGADCRHFTAQPQMEIPHEAVLH